jgi:hypothetical protein
MTTVRLARGSEAARARQGAAWDVYQELLGTDAPQNDEFIALYEIVGTKRDAFYRTARTALPIARMICSRMGRGVAKINLTKPAPTWPHIVPSVSRIPACSLKNSAGGVGSSTSVKSIHAT